MCNIRDKCELCRKQIYMHDVALVCTYDTKIYHAKCLKIDRTIALELQNAPEWFCPCCLENIFPFFNTDISGTIINPDKCSSCAKFISSSRDKVSKCLLCDGTFHFDCLSESKICRSCFQNTNFLDENINLNIIFKSNCFNPYSVLELEEENYDRSMFYHDDDYDNNELANDTISTAKNVLYNCKFLDPDSLPNDMYAGT